MEPAELRKAAERWIEDDPDPDTRSELRALLRQPDPAATDLADRFAAPLEFGTAGLRGVLAAGPNRMNLAVVVRATWGLAQELLAGVPGAAMRGVVVGGDARRMSRQFAEHAAVILAAAGIKVTLFRTPVPTPLVGFAVKSLGAAAGVVVTASHNPPEYNGYKVYWENAAQIVPPIDARIAAAIARAPAATDVVQKALRDMEARALVTDAPASLERAYLDAIGALAVHPRAGDRALRIVYTPLHGVGDALVRRALSEGGFTDVTSVPQQQKPDGAFPTVAFPNPEEKGAMDLAFALARTTGAHLVLANDPDADRLAMAVPEGDGFRQLTGNQVGVLLGHYLLTEKPARGPRAVLASVVSSPHLGRIAGTLGVRYEETLTGFKWIANRAMEIERDPERPCEFVFGYEEALGYCVGDVVRDKDGISGALLAAEVVAVLKERGKTVQDELEAIARRWGVFASTQVNVTRKGVSGVASLRAMMARLRGSPPRRVGDEEVVAVSDYEARTRTDLRSRGVAPLTLPKSNVLAFELASGSRIIARPSGT
ncbi:MAG TPA: phospho-sugar mutase, partial [Polyangiaceae bacterium]|nr:phospho-sugar mutase [Polyangiaceae bacterium]